MNPDLLSYLLTVAQSNQFRKDLLALRDSMYRTENVDSVKLQAEVLKTFSFLSELRISVASIKEVEDLIALHEGQVKAVTEVRIIGAVTLPESLIHSIYTTILGLVKKPFLIDLVIDHKIIGGLIVYINGKQYDHSVKAIAETELKAQRPSPTAVPNHV